MMDCISCNSKAENTGLFTMQKSLWPQRSLHCKTIGDPIEEATITPARRNQRETNRAPVNRSDRQIDLWEARKSGNRQERECAGAERFKFRCRRIQLRRDSRRSRQSEQGIAIE
jgi:hypothetical protein